MPRTAGRLGPGDATSTAAASRLLFHCNKAAEKGLPVATLVAFKRDLQSDNCMRHGFPTVIATDGRRRTYICQMSELDAKTRGTSAVDSTRYWTQLLQTWPKEVSRRGILVTTLNDQIPFKGFMLSDGMFVLERTMPDSLGSRFVLLAFDSIASIKLLDALQDESFKAMGFSGTFSA